MAFNNEIKLIGNLVKEPYVSDKGFAKIRVAANTRRGDKEDTLFIDIKLFGNVYNDFIYHDIQKGDKIISYGRLAIEEYKDKNDITRREAVVFADSLFLVAKKKKSENSF